MSNLLKKEYEEVKELLQELRDVEAKIGKAKNYCQLNRQKIKLERVNKIYSFQLMIFNKIVENKIKKIFKKLGRVMPKKQREFEELLGR